MMGSAPSDLLSREMSAGRLRVFACDQCGRPQHPPRPFCPACSDSQWHLVDLPAEATLVSWTEIWDRDRSQLVRPAIARFAVDHHHTVDLVGWLEPSAREPELDASLQVLLDTEAQGGAPVRLRLTGAEM